MGGVSELTSMKGNWLAHNRTVNPIRFSNHGNQYLILFDISAHSLLLIPSTQSFLLL